jgi:hypothetical protein
VTPTAVWFADCCDADDPRASHLPPAGLPDLEGGSPHRRANRVWVPSTAGPIPPCILSGVDLLLSLGYEY